MTPRGFASTNSVPEDSESIAFVNWPCNDLSVRRSFVGAQPAVGGNAGRWDRMWSS